MTRTFTALSCAVLAASALFCVAFFLMTKLELPDVFSPKVWANAFSSAPRRAGGGFLR